MSSKRGYSLERFQMGQVARAIDLFAQEDLKGAATTILGTWTPPLGYGSAILRAFGFQAAAAGGAQTINGLMYLQINGVSVTDTNSVVISVASVVNHAAWQVSETTLNQTPVSAGSTAGSLIAAPLYPVVAAGDVVTWIVGVAGTGAGSQTIWPYLLFSEAPGLTT